tara:strand:- start:1771 stop:2508 length:738 start_codon:yes stop_codon:yes gene_type:complete
MTLVEEAVAAFLTTTKKARSLDKVVQDNIVFILMNIRDAVSTDVMENQLYELEGTHSLLMGKASASYLKKLATFNTTLANYIHNENNKEKEVIATTPQPQPKEETVTKTEHKFIKLLKHLKVSGAIPAEVLACVRVTTWAGGRQFTNTRNGGHRWSLLLAEASSAANAGDSVICRLVAKQGLNYAMKVQARAFVRVTHNLSGGYVVTEHNTKGQFRIKGYRNNVSEANSLATKVGAGEGIRVDTI